MAVVQNPIIGRARGQAGGMVFTTQFGKNVIKSKPLQVAYSDTDAQKMRRGMIAWVVLFFRSCVEMIQIGFSSLAQGMSAYNAFSSYNLKNGFNTDSPPTVTPDYSKILISKGTMAKTELIGVTCDILDGVIGFSYDGQTLGMGQSKSDKPLMVIYNQTKNEYYSGSGTTQRDDDTAELPIPAQWEENDVLHCWLGFTNVEGTAQSDSDYDTILVTDTTP